MCRQCLVTTSRPLSYCASAQVRNRPPIPGSTHQCRVALAQTPRMLKTSTSSKRVHALFRQGLMFYMLMPSMPERCLKLTPLVERFADLIHQRQMFQKAFSSL